jgi:hypothetical protein
LGVLPVSTYVFASDLAMHKRSVRANYCRYRNAAKLINIGPTWYMIGAEVR